MAEPRSALRGRPPIITPSRPSITASPVHYQLRPGPDLASLLYAPHAFYLCVQSPPVCATISHAAPHSAPSARTPALEPPAFSRPTSSTSLEPASAQGLTQTAERQDDAEGGEGDLHIMGHLYPHRSPHRGLLHELHPPDAQDPSHPRDRHLHLLRCVLPPHETCPSAHTQLTPSTGMFVGLILRLAAQQAVLGVVTFNYQFFFNLLLPPIILASGYELHQGNFFHNIGTILTFAFAGTFISAVVLGILLYLWALIPLEAMSLSWVDALSVGATLSATDPVTILAIFNTYKVDPKLYTVIFGESILNDAIAIVLFETAQRYRPRDTADGETTPEGSLNIVTLVDSFGFFVLVFMTSLLIGLVVGIGTSLLLKYTYIRRFPKLESCVILLIAYASYFFANAVHMSGIVSLLFCGICLKHYAYFNMSRRTQLTIKFIFQVLAQLTENFIFIYLGLSLFTSNDLEFKPLFILITVLGICVARYLAVFPLSSAINAVIRYRARRRGREPEEMPFSHQMMLYWAGLRGAVGVALAAGLEGSNGAALRATVLVVVVLTVIIFGGTTARMLEILNIRTGVVEEIDSDDEFDIEPVNTYLKRNGTGIGHNAKPSNDHIPLSAPRSREAVGASYSSGTIHNTSSPPARPGSALSRKGSRANGQNDSDLAAQALLDPDDLDFDDAELDLPPSARRPGAPGVGGGASRTVSAPAGVTPEPAGGGEQSATSGLRSFLQRPVEDPAAWFRTIDEGFIKPHLLLDPGDGSDRNQHGPGNV
ncbi:hypothetical protein FH972_023650 [Carpinus fangiana]|uniref:Sodium/hydrogen exchanger n=1 Tax=Carpinus fangiana TaxID=176857 RepID=A0A5N6KVT7_9ROSI|nr:hypothetical protein FH972_023650 [Carpinus fangiana]